MRFKDLIRIIYSDLYRYGGKPNKIKLIRYLLFVPGFKYTFWLRITQYLNKTNPFYLVSRLILKRYQYRYGIEIPYSTKISEGIYISHGGGLVINGHAIIGKNFTTNHGVTIGLGGRGTKRGVPVIGDNVYIGPGAKIFGSIKIGNNVSIGANAVVSKDIPDNAVVVGIPGKVISYNGSTGYVNNIDYE